MFLGLALIFTPLFSATGVLTIMTIANLIYIRSGFAARGAWGPPDLPQLIRTGFRMAVFYVATAGFFLGLGVGIVTVLELYKIVDVGREFAKFLPYSPLTLLNIHPALLTAIAVPTLLYTVLFAAMQTPLAAGAANVNEKSVPNDFFYGFGSRFVSHWLLIVGTMAAFWWFSIAPNMQELVPVAISLTTGRTWQGLFLSEPASYYALVEPLGYLCLAVWLTSLQNAAAALSYLDARKRYAADHQASLAVTLHDPDDVRNLRASRMQQGGPPRH